MVTTTSSVDHRNQEFWDELCGTTFARSLGLVGHDRATLDAFDRSYFDFYPYLLGYVDRFPLAGARVLEIGLGYGTLGEEIVKRGAVYHGLDIAAGPVRMMQHRLAMLGVGGEERIVQGSATAIPHPDASFDFVYTIGCLHHTGALAQSVEEVRRVLVPGGWAVVMIYHARSARRIKMRLRRTLAPWRGQAPVTEVDIARMYDADSTGLAAPHTDFSSRRQARRLFRRFDAVEIDTHNFEDFSVRGRMLTTRDGALGTWIERWYGLDLYIVARR